MHSRMAVSAVQSLGHSFRRVPWDFFDAGDFALFGSLIYFFPQLLGNINFFKSLFLRFRLLIFGITEGETGEKIYVAISNNPSSRAPPSVHTPEITLPCILKIVAP